MPKPQPRYPDFTPAATCALLASAYVDRIDSRSAAAAPVAPTDGTDGILIEDWDALFSTIKASLQRAAADRVSPVLALAPDDRPGRDGSAMQACLAALDRLQQGLTLEMARSRKLELEGSALALAPHRRSGRDESAMQACLAALDRLQQGLTLEVARSRKLELEVRAAHAALAQAQADLAGNQAGESGERTMRATTT